MPSQTVEITTVRLLTDSSTHALLVDLANAYRPVGMVMTWNIQQGEARAVLEWLSSSSVPYALVNYVPDLFTGKNLWTTPIGQNGIAVVVHPSNPVSNLTAAQLRAVLQGRITNWQDVGGSNIPITIVARPDSSSDTTVIQSVVLGERRLTRAARLATTPESVISVIASDPGAIGYVSMGYVTSAVKAISLDEVVLTADTVSNGTYPLSTPILFVGVSEPGNDAYRAFFAWAQSPEGQAVVRQRYVALRNE